MLNFDPLDLNPIDNEAVIGKKKKTLREKCNCICVSGSYDGLKKFPLQPILSFGQQDLHNHQSWSLHFCKLDMIHSRFLHCIRLC